MKDHREGREDLPDRQSAPVAPTPSTILVPVDGPASCATLLPLARTLAGIYRGQVRLLYVTQTSLPAATPREGIDGVGLDLEGLVVDQRTGDAATIIMQVARQHAVSLVVMATTCWTSDPATPLGRVTEAVLRGSRCPLVLVSEQAGRRLVSKGHSLSRVLLPLDGSVEAAKGLTQFAPLLGRPETVIDVLHVVHKDAEMAAREDIFTVPRYLDQPFYGWAAWRREFAARFRDGLGWEPASVRVAVGNPAREIVAAARKHGNDLIVVVWKGALVAGHARTLRAVLRHAPCPVLVVQT